MNTYKKHTQLQISAPPGKGGISHTIWKKQTYVPREQKLYPWEKALPWNWKF